MVTGGINAGKTTKMAEIYRLCPRGDGFLSRKIFITPECWVGYELVRLSSQEKIPLAYKAEYVPMGFAELYRQGPFCFAADALKFAEKIIAELIHNQTEPIYIDEIGPLELNGKGFAPLLTHVLNAGKELILAVRSHCVTAVIHQFNIQNVELLKI
jgi:nucleoside-triphosphatase THEP1